MQVCFISLMDFNDFNEICGQIQRVPPLIIFKDFTFSKNPFGIAWVAWKGAVQYSTWSIPRHIGEDWAPVPFGFHFWICRGSLGSARSVLQMVNSKSHWSRSGTAPFWMDLESWNRENLEMSKGGTLWFGAHILLKSLKFNRKMN